MYKITAVSYVACIWSHTVTPFAQYACTEVYTPPLQPHPHMGTSQVCTCTHTHYVPVVRLHPWASSLSLWWPLRAAPMPLWPPPSVSGCLQSGSDHSRLGYCQSALKWEEGGKVEMEGLESEQENVCIVQYMFVDAKMHCTQLWMQGRQSNDHTLLSHTHTVIGHVRK